MFAVASAFLACFLSVAVCRGAPAPERSVSSSRQFIVYGSDLALRGAICEVAERIKRDTLRLLGARDDWRTPVVIEAQLLRAPLPDTARARLRVSQTGAGLKFQLELRLTRDLNVPEVERQLLRAILLEMMYRAQPDTPAGAPYVEPPEWLLDGTLALSSGRDADAITKTLATAVAGETWTLEKFLHQKRALLDSPAQNLFRAYAAALVTMLLESAEGRARLARFVAHLPRASNDPLADLVSHFPELGIETARETNWRASVVRLAGSERFRVLTCPETERELAGILRVNVPGEQQTAVFALEEFREFLRNPAAAPDLERLGTELLLLSGRAHPLYRPIVAEYQKIASQLLRRKSARVERRLTELRATREGLSRRMEAIADYMNWYEATQAQNASGSFRDYLRAAELALEPAPRRRDPISVYLDALQTQF